MQLELQIALQIVNDVFSLEKWGASLYFHYNGIHNQRMYTYYIGKLKSTRIKNLFNIDISCLLDWHPSWIPTPDILKI
jgi:hypothetical protein